MISKNALAHSIVMNLMGIGLVIGAFVGHSLLRPLIGEDAPFLLFYVAILVVAWRGGFRNGLIATVCAVLLCALSTADRAGTGKWISLSVFALEATAINLLVQRLSSPQRPAESSRDVQKSDEKRPNEQLQLAKEAANLGVYDYDIPADSIEWDARLRELWGVGADEHINYQTFMEGILPDDRASVQAAIDQGLEPDEGGHYFAEYRVVHRITGDIRWISAIGKVYFNERQPVRLIGIVQDITQEKVLQTRLETTLTEFKQLADAMPQLVWTANEHAEVDYYNRRASDFDGITQNADGTWKYEPVIHPDDVDRTLNAWQHAVASNEDYECEHRIHMADGTYRWHISRAVCQFSAENKQKWYGTATDIHELKQIQQSLHESEARFRNMADNAPVMIWVTEADGNCIYLSQSWYEFTGQTPATGLGFGWLDATHPEDRDRAHQIFINASEKQESFSIDYRLRRADGDYRWAIDSARPRFTSDGQFIGYIGSVIDITERKQQEELLRQQRASLQQLVDSIPVMITIYDPQVGILYLNKEFERLTGWNRETALEVDFMAEIYPDPVMRGMAEAHMQSLEPGWRTFEVTAQDATVIDSSWANIRLLDGSHVGIGIDIRERLINEKRNHILRTLAAALSKALSPQEVTEVTLQNAIAKLDAVGGTVAILSADGSHLEIVGSYGYPAAVIEKWRTIPLDHPTAPIALAVREERALWMRSLQEREQIIPLTPELTTGELHAAWVVVPFNVDNQLRGVFGLGFDTPQAFDQAERTFFLTLVDTCAQALARAHLSERLRETAAAEERHRLARDLHDAVKQLLFASSAMSEALPKMLERKSERAQEISLEINRLNRAALAEMAILLQAMRPEIIVTTSFKTLMKNLCDALEGKSQTRATLNWMGPTALYLPENVHVTLYRLTQEAFNNIAKHSNADNVIIDCVWEEDTLNLDIRDDGNGFNLRPATTGMGMNTMRERAASVGAEFHIESTPGEGTAIVVKWQGETD